MTDFKISYEMYDSICSMKSTLLICAAAIESLDEEIYKDLIDGITDLLWCNIETIYEFEDSLEEQKEHIEKKLESESRL